MQRNLSTCCHVVSRMHECTGHQNLVQLHTGEAKQEQRLRDQCNHTQVQFLDLKSGYDSVH